jgi:uncharacterized repeat protein (TIGR01451 family)
MGGREGAQISDVATVSGGFEPTGSVTFNLYGPNDFECEGTPIFSDEVDLEADGTATSGAFTVTTVGTYLWIASYSGDANNNPVAGECGDEGETTIIEQFAPTITTVLHADGVEPAPTITVLFGTAVQDQAILADFSPTAGGTITFTVYTDDECTDVFADAGTKAVTMGTAPWSDPVTFDVPGTYYWQAEYSGDANNAPAISECTDEVLTVTSPDLDVTKLVRTGSTGEFGPTSVADPGDVLEFQITIENTGDADADDVPVSDDLADLLAHATYNDDCNLSCTEVGTELRWTVDVPTGESITLTFSVTLDDSFPAGTTHLPNVVVVTGPGSNCPEASTDPDCDTDTTVQAQPAVHATKLVRTNAGSFGPTSTAQPGDTLTFQITITNSGNAPATNVPVEDDIAALLDHATYNDDCSDGCDLVGTVLEWTIASIAANGGTEVLTFSVTLDGVFPVGTTTLPNVVVVIAPGSNCPAQSDDPDCDTTTTVDVRSLTIDKSFTGNTGGTGPGGVPEAKVGDVLTFTLAYDVTNPPVHNGVITDVLPAGLAYVDDSASDNDEFTFTSFTAGTRTLRWDADLVSKDGSVTYQVLVVVGSDQLPQPLVNVATIDSDETEPDSDTERVFVEPVPLAVTGSPKLTLPPTSTLDTPQGGTSNTGFSLMLVLLGLAGFVLILGFVTPVPARARRRDRR